MSDKIDMITQQMITPKRLRTRYGDLVGLEVCTLLPIIKQDRNVILKLLRTLDNIWGDEQKMEFIKTVWQRYYISVADTIIDIGDDESRLG